MIFKDDRGFRFFAPFEILSALGFPKCTVLSADSATAFQQAGNAISLPHAVLQIVKTHKLLADRSPFQVDDAAAVLHDAQKAAIRFSELEQVRCGEFRCLRERPLTEAITPPAAKKLKVAEVISPTIPFTIEHQPSLLATEELDFEPAFAVKKVGTAVALQPFCNGGMATISHSQKHWKAVVHGSAHESVGSLMHRTLPHARECHFLCFAMNDSQLAWNDAIQCNPMSLLTFTPCAIPFDFSWENGATSTLCGDVTWTTSTALAFLAADKKCPVDSLVLHHEDTPIDSDDFLVTCKSSTFQVRFKAMQFVYDVTEAAMKVCKDPGIAPRTNKALRWVAKHPLMKLTKTACGQNDSKFAMLVRTLFPDLATSLRALLGLSRSIPRKLMLTHRCLTANHLLLNGRDSDPLHQLRFACVRSLGQLNHRIIRSSMLPLPNDGSDRRFPARHRSSMLTNRCR